MDGRIIRPGCGGVKLRPNSPWHPDGTRLVFLADPDWRDELKYESPDLWTVTIDGKVTRLTNDLFVLPTAGGRPAAGGQPINLTANWDLEPGATRWAPDGRFIYFTAAIGGEHHLFRVSVPAGQPHGISGNWNNVHRMINELAWWEKYLNP